MKKIKLFAIPILLLGVTATVACNARVYDSVEISLNSYDLTKDYNNPELIDTFADLTDDEKEMFKYMKKEVWKKSEFIDLSAYNVKLSNFYNPDNLPWYAAVDVYRKFRIANMDLPFLNEVADYEYFEQDGSTYLKGFKVTYLDLDMDTFYNSKNEALSLLTNDMTDYEKYLTIHDFIITRTIYDVKDGVLGMSWYDDCAYGPLALHTSTCAGYSWAFKYICNCAGLPCYIMDKSEVCHQWNLVIVDNEPYYIDSTWDDDYTPGVLATTHSNFLVNEEECKANHGSWWDIYNYGKEITITSTSTKYKNAFWRDASSEIVKYDGYYYYSSKDYSRNEANVIYRTPINDLSKKEEIAVNPGEYPNIEGFTPGAAILNSKYIAIKNNRLWINDGKGIISMELNGSNIKREYQVLKDNWYFAEAYDSEGETYYTMYDPNDNNNYTVALLTDEYKVNSEPENTNNTETNTNGNKNYNSIIIISSIASASLLAIAIGVFGLVLIIKKKKN